MSDVTPLSYIDDGVSFAHRLPSSTSLTNVARWLNSTASDATSTYTGSYIDDGADMLVPSGPGFGKVDPRFYKHKKRRDTENAGLWNDSIARAISGDVQRSVARMQGIADLEVKRPERNKQEERKRRQRKETVRVPVPMKWGTFIIKGDDGRIIVVDEKGEFDSGLVKKADAIDNETAKRWVKAASSVDVPSSTHQSAPQDDSATISSKANGPDSKSRSRAKTKPRASYLQDLAPKPKSLSPIPESSYESDSYVKVSPLASPTNFFMTGGLSGWPSRAPTPDPPSPVVPHTITWDTTPPPRGTPTNAKSDMSSPMRSPPGTWPSPPISPVKSNSSFSNPKCREVREKNSSRTSSKDEKTKSGSSSPKRRTKKLDEASTKTYSTYRPPTIVEVIYDETPPGEVSHSQIGWGGGEAVSAHSWGGSRANDSVKSAHTRSSVCDRGWGGSASALDWDGDKAAGSRASANDYWIDNDNENENGEYRYNDWDGFERRKTTSEISIAGSESERSWPKSQRSQRIQHGHRAHGSDRSHRSSRHSQTDWSGSQISSKADGNVQWDGSNARWDGSNAQRGGSNAQWGSSNAQWGSSNAQWGGSNAQSVHSERTWRDSDLASPLRGATSTLKYHNDFDEFNEKHLNKTRGRIPVRVASRRTSVAGWD